ncbi:MAG TPA: ABC transporter ATP-binding protein [Acidimicrobiales bacterium]
MSAVTLRGIRKAFGPVVAVDSVDLDLAEGRITALLGPSGCGKTTTLRLIAGFDRPDAGEIAIGGDVVAGAGHAVPPERRGIGMVFQQLALFPHLDVAGNIAYGLRGSSRSDRAARVGDLLDLVGLGGMGHRLPHELSGGEAQRVALARALAPKPQVVLLDEPFSSLDVALRAELRGEVRRILQAACVTTLVVTHDQDEALSIGDAVAVMFEGRVAQVGAPEDVYRHPASQAVAEFLGDANAVAGRATGGMVETEVGTLRSDVADGDVVVLVRAEDVDLAALDGEGDPGATGATEAIVEDVDYFGHDQLVSVRLPSGARIEARLHARRRLPRGATVTVAARPDGPVVAFPAGAGGQHSGA